MDGLLAKDWTFEEFMNRYIFIKPEDVLVEPESMRYLFERYRKDGDKIDFLAFMDDVFSIESSSSYMNAFSVAGMPYYDPYARLKMADELDLYLVRHGEPKYLIRRLMEKSTQRFLFRIKFRCQDLWTSISKTGKDQQDWNSGKILI